MTGAKRPEEWRDFTEATREGLPAEFAGPTDLPESPDQAVEWQRLNRAWWESHPMRYDFDRAMSFEEGTVEFYRDIDERLLRSARDAFPWRSVPFDNFIDFDLLAGQRVLEIGVGCGIHAELLARHAADYVGIDLTDYAARTTTRRLELFGVKGRILKMDAEALQFDNASFDFVWSWGVIHHSSNTRRILEEVHRVLRPGGTFVAMVYHRSSWNHFVRGALYYGVLRGGFYRGRTLNDLMQETTDGAIARYYTASEWKALVGDLFDVESISIIGHKTQLIPIAYGRLKSRLAGLIPGWLGRFLTNRSLMGYMLVATMKPKTRTS
jgi:ubiquinone/menaquinone biosynthesis C-methylase UbiE